MNRIIVFIFLIVAGITAVAQSPNKINYQAVARDNTGAVLTNQSLSFRISILQGSTSGLSVYSETHTVTSNGQGLVNFAIGDGSSAGSLANVNWGFNDHFLKIEMDALGGSNYTLMGTSQLLSVPYALHAETSGDSKWDENINGIYHNSGRVGIGTINPSEDLEVDGTVKMDDIKIGNTSLLPSNAASDIKILSSSNSLDAVLTKNPVSTLNSSFGALNNRDIRVTMGVGGSGRSQVFQNNWAFLKTTDNLSSVSTSGLAIGHASSSAPIIFMQNNQEKVRIDPFGKVGIGTTLPKSGLHISSEDVYIDDATKGVIMKSPNGQCWRMTVNNLGAPVFNSIVCP